MEGTLGSSSILQRFFQILHARVCADPLLSECRPGLLSGIPDIRCGVISEVHAGDGFQFWNIIDFHTLPCVNAKFYKFRNDSFDLSTGMHIKEYAQFVAAVNGFLDLWFDQGTPYIPGRRTCCSGYPQSSWNIRTSGL